MYASVDNTDNTCVCSYASVDNNINYNTCVHVCLLLPAFQEPKDEATGMYVCIINLIIVIQYATHIIVTIYIQLIIFHRLRACVCMYIVVVMRES